MAKLVDYYFTPVSPYTYLGHQRLLEIAARHGATIAVKPVDYGRFFRYRVACRSSSARRNAKPTG